MRADANIGRGKPTGASNRGTTKHIAVAAMTSVFHLFASIALALPAFPAGNPAALVPLGPGDQDVWAAALDSMANPANQPLRMTTQPLPPPAGPLAVTTTADTWHQVRIEQQVIIRISPREPGRDALAPQVLPLQPMMQPLNPMLRPRPVQMRMRERKAGKCLPAQGIAAVQPTTDGRLMFYMRDRRTLAAGLEKTCSARDFYLGFYMSKTSDGQLCAGRDPIHSRAGTTCKLKEVREFVPAE